MIPTEMLRSGAAEMNIALTDHQLAQFDQYAALLTEWNEKMNLTGITDPEAIVVRHFLDSLSVLACTEVPQGASVVDVGTGAGFPGIPLAVIFLKSLWIRRQPLTTKYRCLPKPSRRPKVSRRRRFTWNEPIP